ncbi:hypothetical protein LguiB_012482 [Lonicera macranthoides]
MKLESLGCLVMDGCKSIETLPELSKLKSLKALPVLNCKKLTEIQGLEELKSLKYLDIEDCECVLSTSLQWTMKNYLKNLESSLLTGSYSVMAAC